MLSTSAALAKKLSTALKESGIRQTDVAAACNVSKQAVQGWVKTGRIDKKHLNTLAAITGKPLSWWLADLPTVAAGEPGLETHADPFSDWRLQASPKSLEVIDQLTTAAQLNAFSDEDWELLQIMATRFARK